jgi:hypothetical protein
VVFSYNLAPSILVQDSSFGIQSNSFGFKITGIPGSTIIIETRESSTDAEWTAIQTNVVGAQPMYFTDPATRSSAGRLYRLRMDQ